MGNVLEEVFGGEFSYFSTIYLKGRFINNLRPKISCYFCSIFYWKGQFHFLKPSELTQKINSSLQTTTSYTLKGSLEFHQLKRFFNEFEEYVKSAEATPKDFIFLINENHDVIHFCLARSACVEFEKMIEEVKFKLGSL